MSRNIDPDTYTGCIESHRHQYLDDLLDLVAQPSISTTNDGIHECSNLVKQLCADYGFDSTSLIETDGHPAVLAYADADPDSISTDWYDGQPPTVFLYGHYDVQPVDSSKWTTPPFEPTIRAGPDGNDRIYARGVGDNKGQWFAHLCAVHALRATTGLPVNVTLLLEGEEEKGSPHLDPAVRTLADDISPDIAIVADGSIDPTGRPQILMGARGILYIQLDATGPDRNLHSGKFGGPAPNPAWELIKVLASMKDQTGRITIEGFYDDVRQLTPADHAALDDLPTDVASFQADIGVDTFAPGPGETYLEQLLYQPTANIAGFASGYDEEGVKTIIPSSGTVKMDFRLVADQDPDDIYEKVERHIAEVSTGPSDIDVSKLVTMRPQRTPMDHPVRDPLVEAARIGWQQDPIVKPTLAGSLPTAVFTDHFDVPCVIIPYANSDENQHSPNENLALWCFDSGIKTTAAMLHQLASSDWKQ